MTITADNQSTLLEWAQRCIGVRFRPDAKAIGRISDGQVRAVVVYDNFSDCDCSMHIASDGTGRWLTRPLLSAAFHYPFIQLGLRRVTGLVPAKNKAALHFDRRLGFKFEGLARCALPDDDIVMLGMTRAECLFIPKEHRHV